MPYRIRLNTNRYYHNFLGGSVGKQTSVNRRSQLASLFHGLVDGMLDKVGNQLFVHGSTIVDGSVGQLIDKVVETRRPLAGASLGGDGAIVDHEGNSTVVHIRAQRVDGSNDTLIDKFRIRVSLFEETINLCHHGGNVDTSGKGVDLEESPCRECKTPSRQSGIWSSGESPS
jgi:hypothetical protein